jgi:hypothetical protein
LCVDTYFQRHFQSLFSNAFVAFQLSQPYDRIGIMFELNKLSFVVLLRVFDVQMLRSLFKALDARAIRCMMSPIRETCLHLYAYAAGLVERELFR